MDSTQAPNAAFLAAYFGVLAIFFLLATAFAIVIQWKIVSKAGFSGVTSLLTLIPVVNLIVIVYFAFSEWPIERALKAAQGGGPPLPPMPPITPYLPPPAL